MRRRLILAALLVPLSGHASQSLGGGSLGGGTSAVDQTARNAAAAAQATANAAQTAASGGSIIPETAGTSITASMCGSTLQYTGSAAASFSVPTNLPTNCHVDLIQSGQGSGMATFAAVPNSGETLESYPTTAVNTAGPGAHMQLIVETATLAEVHP